MAVSTAAVASVMVMMVVGTVSTAVATTVSTTTSLSATRHAVDESADFFWCGVVVVYDVAAKAQVHASQFVIKVNDNGGVGDIFHQAVKSHAVFVDHRNDIAWIDGLGVKMSVSSTEDVF